MYIRFLFSVFIVCVLQTGFAQGVVILKDKEFLYKIETDTAVWNQLHKSLLFKSLEPQQQEFFYWVNVFRKNPSRFYNREIAEFLRQFPEANTSEAKSLERDLKKLQSLTFLMPDDGLMKMSKIHSLDLANRGGAISHVSSNGKNFSKRFTEAGFYRCGAENIFAGSSSALEALIILLIDHQVPDKGHRVNLCDPRFNLMGASFAFINKKRTVLVQEFGCK